MNVNRVINLKMPSALSPFPKTGGLSSAGQLGPLEVTLAKAIAGADLGQVLIQAPIALAVVTMVAVALGWVVAGRALRPVSTITATARRISASNLNERLGLRGPDDELKALGDTLDELFGRLETSFEAQRRFVANASHELRTPLTRERTMLHVALDAPGTTAETWREVARDVLAVDHRDEAQTARRQGKVIVRENSRNRLYREQRGRVDAGLAGSGLRGHPTDPAHAAASAWACPRATPVRPG